MKINPLKHSWRSKSFALLLVQWGIVTSFGQLCPPNILWQQERAELAGGYFYVYRASTQGGYILGGYSYGQNFGLADFYLVRLHPTLEVGWQKEYGGTNSEIIYAVRELADGGLLLGGYSWSGSSGNKTSAHYGDGDFWVVRTDDIGNMLWDRSYGGSTYELLFDAQQTSDGGFIFAGYSYSGASGNKTSPSFGLADYWVVRTDSAGNKTWDHSYGGENGDFPSNIQEVSAGGFILGGSSDSGSTGNKVSENFGGQDYWIIRLNVLGQEIWQRSFGGSANDTLIKVIEGADGGFILVGNSYSDVSGNRTSPQRGYPDIWVVAIDANGDKTWEQSLGGGSYTDVKNVLSVSDGGWLVGATAYGIGGNRTAPSFGNSDYWLVRLGANGNILWDSSYGGKSYDSLFNIDRTTEGVVLIGQSNSRAGGNKTTQLVSSSDLWVVQLGQETPGDCDGDGVPDAQDLCPQTAGGAIVNSNGCSIAQFCPCDGPWTNHEQYVQCVNDTAAQFFQQGLITEEQRTNAVAQAEAANCPFVPTPILAFGLTNFAINTATVIYDQEEYSGMFVGDLGPEGFDGVSMQLGKADSGLFVYPHAPVQDWYNEAWFMEGRTYGSIDGVTNKLLSVMTATKPNYETYPVSVDFTSLSATSVTYQVFSNKMLVTELTEAGPLAHLTIHSATYLSPRANPFWRAPDGSVGATIDLQAPSWAFRFSIDGPFYGVQGDHIFIRANLGNNFTNVIDYISRVDIVLGGGLPNFSVLNARLGMFHRPHQALGTAIFTAGDGKLRVQGRPDSSGYSDDYSGTLVETDSDRLDVQFEPLRLETNGAIFEVSAAANQPDSGPEVFAFLTISNLNGTLELNGSFPPHSCYGCTLDHPLVILKVYSNGSLAGCLTDGDGCFSLTGGSSIPAILAGGGVGGTSNSLPHLFFTLDQTGVFSNGGDASFSGNQFLLLPSAEAGTNGEAAQLSQMTFALRNYPSFTIIDEQSEIVPPTLSIVVSGGNVTLSWPIRNQPFRLESTSSLGTDFTGVTADLELINGQNTVTLPLQGTQFFQLRLAPD